MMKITSLNISDLFLIEPCIFEDSWGCFFESFREDFFKKQTLSNIYFVQDNHVKSSHGVLRGLHYQIPPKAQAKLVRVVRGKVFDVAVDLRKKSSTFGKWIGQVLSEDNMLQMWIPEGFANGFLVLSDYADVVYKITEEYSPLFERSILWNDPNLGISWPIDGAPIVSERDHLASIFTDAEIYS